MDAQTDIAVEPSRGTGLPQWVLKIDERQEIIARALPKDMDIRRFILVAKKHIGEDRNRIAAINNDPKSMLNAVMEAATDGLLLDGRQSALVPRKGKMTYSPMVRGLIDRMHRSGKVDSINVDIVYEGDLFQTESGSTPAIKHCPKYKSKTVSHAYAVVWIKDASHPYIEVIDAFELEKHRKKAGLNTPWNGPWVDEMRKKTVLRRLSKRLPLSATDRAVVERDDQFYDFEGDDTLQPVLPDIKPLSIEDDNQPAARPPEPSSPMFKKLQSDIEACEGDLDCLQIISEDLTEPGVLNQLSADNYREIRALLSRAQNDIMEKIDD